MTRRVFILAGEASGDRLGAALMRALRLKGVEVMGVGGAAMQAEGLESLYPMRDLSVMGLTEVLPALPRIFKRLRDTTEAIKVAQPDILVTIDAQEFASQLHRRVQRAAPEVRRVHYVAPSVWAWKPWRAKKLAARLDHLMTLLPFEPPYFTKHGLSCEFTGHPVVERIPPRDPAAIAAFRAECDAVTAPLLAVLPGSRMSEINRLTEPFGATLGLLKARIPELRVVMPLAESVAEEAKQAVRDWPVTPVFVDPRGVSFAEGERRKFLAFQAADAALAASGTVSLELAACGVPMAIGYRASPVTAFLIRRLAQIDTATLVNLIAGNKVIPEFLQEDCTPEKLAPAVESLLAGAARDRQINTFTEVMTALGAGGPSPSERAAQSLLSVLESPR